MKIEGFRTLALPVAVAAAGVVVWSAAARAQGRDGNDRIGREVAIPRHFADGEEFTRSIQEILLQGNGSSKPSGPYRKEGGVP